MIVHSFGDICKLLHNESINCKAGLDTGSLASRLSVRLGRQVGTMNDVPDSVLENMEENVIDKAHRRTAHYFQVLER